MKAYVLTSEYNMYDQQGEYFIAWFHQKPTWQELRLAIDPMEADDNAITHVLSGGGRRKIGSYHESSWFYLKEVPSSNLA